MAETIFSGVAGDSDLRGTLFQGLKFWVSHKVPQRSRFLSDIKVKSSRVNGGEILSLEKNADVKIVDHARKEAPPGSHSYTFIEKSIRNGTLEDLDDHKVGPPEGNVRSIGSVVQPAKGTRNRYTEADDRILWNWVNGNPQKGGGTDGNEIYKQLEQKHPQHPWQSWRDRWIRHLKGTKAPFPLPRNAPPTPPLDVPSTAESSRNRATTCETVEDDSQFSDDDAEALMVNGDDLLNIHPDNITEALESWTRVHDKGHAHTVRQWQTYWEERVRPRYLRRKAKQARRASPEKTVPTRSQVPISPKRSMAPTAALSPKLSHAYEPHHSSIPESPGKTTTLGLRNPVSSKRPVVMSPSRSKKKDYSLESAATKPSHNLESPASPATAPLTHQRTTDILSVQEPSLRSNHKPHTLSTPEKVHLHNHELLKRKHAAIEEDLLSSSPIRPISPKRKRQSGSELPIEIASTPEKGPEPRIEQPSSPLYIKLELDDDESSPANRNESNRSPSQQLSDTMSEHSQGTINTQAIFQRATPFIDVDVPAPEGGWHDEEPLIPYSGQPVSFDTPPAEDSREDDKRGTRESPQLVDFDLLSPVGGWDDEEPESKSDPESPGIEIYNSQPTLPDTQRILQSETPAPDFSIADPDGGWNSLIASSPPNMPSSPVAESVFSQTELKEQLDAWINAHAVKGISVEQVESVLKSTSMDTALAHEALRHLREKGVLPTNQRGVWTEADDEDLKDTDSRKIQRLQDKHGADCLRARWEFLDFYTDEA